MTYILPNHPFTNIPNDLYTSPYERTIYPTKVITQPIITNYVYPQKYILADSFKPVKAGKNKAHIIFILDDSYSMQTCKSKTIEGFNGYLKSQLEQSKKDKIETFVSLYKFDGNNVSCFMDHIPIENASPLTNETYNPKGSTNLLDAIGGVLIQINNGMPAKKKDRESLIFTILTDGEENASKTFKNNDIKSMVEKAEGANWSFLFLGANIDAFAVGQTLGFGVDNTIQYSVNNTDSAILSASSMTSRLRSAYANGLNTQAAYQTSSFTDEERSKSNGENK